MTTKIDTDDTYSEGVGYSGEEGGSFSYDSIEKSSSGILLSQAIVFATLVLGGIMIFAIISFARQDWFLPALVYGFTIYVAWIKFYVGARGAVDYAGSDDSVEARLQSLEGRLLATLGYVLGEASMKPGNSFEPNNRDGIEEAVALSRRGYDLLKEGGGPAEYLALNNFVFYSAVLNDRSQADRLLSQARDLIEKGQEHSASNLILTGCRVILQFSDIKDEKVHAMELLRSLQSAGSTTNRQRKEAELYINYFSQDLSRKRGERRPTPGSSGRLTPRA